MSEVDEPNFCRYGIGFCPKDCKGGYDTKSYGPRERAEALMDVAAAQAGDEIAELRVLARITGTERGEREGENEGKSKLPPCLIKVRAEQRRRITPPHRPVD